MRRKTAYPPSADCGVVPVRLAMGILAPEALFLLLASEAALPWPPGDGTRSGSGQREQGTPPRYALPGETRKASGPHRMRGLSVTGTYGRGYPC
jgi:hypothetical protein